MTVMTRTEQPSVRRPLPLPPATVGRGGKPGWMGGLVALLGFGLAIWVGTATYVGMVDDLAGLRRAQIPSARVVELDEEGRVLDEAREAIARGELVDRIAEHRVAVLEHEPALEVEHVDRVPILDDAVQRGAVHCTRLPATASSTQRTDCTALVTMRVPDA